jgi:E3 ubiquitin-protein ligase UBR4
MKIKVPGVAPFWIENTASDTQFVAVAEGLTSCLIEAGQVSMLVRMLSTLLNRYLLAYQKAFLAIIDNDQHDVKSFPSLLLLKHSSFDKCLHDEVFKNGTSFCNLDYVFDLLSKLDVVVDKRAPGIQCKVFWECMLHGFPSHLRTPSAVFLSCTLSIRGIIFLLDKLFRVEDLREKVSLETEVMRQILDSVMTVKFDRIFESLQGKCEDIVRNLGTGSELSDYTDLFLMKHMEGFLREINGRGVSDSSIYEWIITKIINTADSLKKDPIKSVIFKFYLGAEDMPEMLKDFCGLQRGDLLVLIDSLDDCCSESVNGKVLSFFVDILSGDFCPDLKQKIREKFFGMDLHDLSKWLEKRLLGCVVEASEGGNSAKGNSVSFRETTMSFILSLVSSPSEAHLMEHSHLFEAVLASLDTAFLLFDVHIAKSYFHFVVQLSRGEYSMKLLLKRTIMLMEKLAGDEHLLPGLKFLFGFLGSLLSDFGSTTSSLEKSLGKPVLSGSLGAGSVAFKSLGSRKNSDTLVLSANQEGGSSALECDANSVDDEEDDGTSDGEVASIDKDEEEDTNSERALASKVCTFTSSGSNFMEQHWYFCYTCDLTGSKGCCSVCAKVCHRGHRVVYSRSSRFFCDCGAGGVRGSSCQCLKARKFTGSDSAPIRNTSNFQSFLPFTADADHLPESDSELDEDAAIDADNSLRLSIPRELQDRMPMLLEEVDVEGQVLQICSSLLSSITSKRDPNLSVDKKVILGKDKVLSYGVELLQLKKAYKSGSLDLKIKADYSNAKELRSHLASGSLFKSLLSVNNRGRLAVGEGDKVAIFDVGQLIGQATIAPVTADKTNVKPLSRNVVRFEIVHLAFNSVAENYLAVAGYEDCHVLTLNPRGEVTDRLAIELALQGAYIRRVDWVPGSQVRLMVVTNRFIKIYDLAQDNISPVHYFTLPNEMIVDATLIMASQGRMFLIVLSEQGNLFRLQLSVEGNVGATPLKEIIAIQDREINAKGSSLYFSTTYKLLMLSYQDGTTLMGRLSPDATSLTEISFVYEDEQDGRKSPAGLHRWKELLVGSGLFVCFSSMKSNAALAVSLGPHELHSQNMRHTVGSTLLLVGLTAYKPLSKDKVHCLVLHDDGSLQIYSHVPAGADTTASVTAEKVKKLGSGILNKAYAGVKPEFPLDFFEKTVCITADVKLGGDAIRNGDAEAAKHTLASEDGFLESPSPAGFKVLLMKLELLILHTCFSGTKYLYLCPYIFLFCFPQIMFLFGLLFESQLLTT